MAAASLHPQDHVSVYAVDCNLVRSAQRVIPEPDVLSAAVQAAVSSPALKEGYAGDACSTPAPMWASIVRIVEDMSDSPNRRALLIVSSGSLPDKLSWGDVHHIAAAEGVAVFGMNDGPGLSDLWRTDKLDPFRMLCESTGGIIMYAQTRSLEKQLEQWVTLLRNRYVVEFPDPQRLGTGTHSIQVSIKRDDMAFVTLAGVSVSLPDPRLTSDPHYLPSQQGEDIPVGTRRPLEPK